MVHLCNLAVQLTMPFPTSIAVAYITLKYQKADADSRTSPMCLWLEPLRSLPFVGILCCRNGLSLGPVMRILNLESIVRTILG